MDKNFSPYFQELLNYIIKHANSSIAIHDRQMNYLYVSEKYLQEYKITNLDVIGKNHYEVFPDLPLKWREAHKRALKGESEALSKKMAEDWDKTFHFNYRGPSEICSDRAKQNSGGR